MSDMVVDSSVAAKWVIAEADSGQALRLVSEIAVKGERLFVLDLALIEVGNAIWKQVHRGRITPAEAKGLLAALLQSPVHIEAAHQLLSPAMEIAVKYDRAIYDALFVALAQRHGIQGVTADEALYHAVRADFPEIILLRDW
jgi:predicted nucleic acid-binding protein